MIMDAISQDYNESWLTSNLKTFWTGFLKIDFFQIFSNVINTQR